MIYSIKPKFQKFLDPVKKLFIKMGISPTTINFLALIISITGAIAIVLSQNYILFLIYIPIMAFVRTALNALDGLVARTTKAKNQQFGEVLNEVIDRVSDIIIFGAFLFTTVDTKLTAIAISLILLNSYLGIVGKAAGGKRIYSGLIGKADRMFYLSIAAILVLAFNNFIYFEYMMIFLIIGTTITLIQRFSSIKRELIK